MGEIPEGGEGEGGWRWDYGSEEAAAAAAAAAALTHGTVARHLERSPQAPTLYTYFTQYLRLIRAVLGLIRGPARGQFCAVVTRASGVNQV
jgi:hypothetical protein